MGYIICPISIPVEADPADWLTTAESTEGWRELGQIINALRAHGNERIEDVLSNLLLVMPQPPRTVNTLCGIAGEKGGDGGARYYVHEGESGSARAAVGRVLAGGSVGGEFQAAKVGSRYNDALVRRCTQILVGKTRSDGTPDISLDTVRREPTKDGVRGAVDVEKTMRRARDMVAKGGRRPGVKRGEEKVRTYEEISEEIGSRILSLSQLGEFGDAIKTNLLAGSGIAADPIERDINLLREAVLGASRHLEGEGLREDLNRHFGLDAIKGTANGCTLAALIMMNAAMAHQRIALADESVVGMDVIKNSTSVIAAVRDEWVRMGKRGYEALVEPAAGVIDEIIDPTLGPAVAVLDAIGRVGKIAGLERALRHIAVEAEQVTEKYDTLGADHAGPLFNQVMGNQASDGAFFTRPVAASLAAGLALDAVEGVDWGNVDAVRECKIVDLACGSGTLLAAALTDIKRRARDAGATEDDIREVQRTLVEDCLKGLDINPVSLQLAASRLIAGDYGIPYRRVGLHLMPYGGRTPEEVKAGTLEVIADGEDVAAGVEAVRDARAVIMNPPFSSRIKMGEKFPKDIKDALCDRVDEMGSTAGNKRPWVEGVRGQKCPWSTVRGTGRSAFGFDARRVDHDASDHCVHSSLSGNGADVAGQALSRSYCVNLPPAKADQLEREHGHQREYHCVAAAH